MTHKPACLGGATWIAIAFASALSMATATMVGTSNALARGAIYARYSTRFQHSNEDQIRVCRAWAEANGVTIADRHIFTDEAKTGKSHRRTGLVEMIESLKRDEFDVVVCFATNRIYRKVYRSLQFVEEEIFDRRKRCVFVAQMIDTAKSDFWRSLLQVFVMLDEIHVQMIKGQVNAAQEGLAIQDMVWGTITFGYRGRPIEGRLTRQGKPRTVWAIDVAAAEWVKKIFTMFVVEERSHAEIARELNRQGAPLPPRTTVSRWTPLAVCRVLGNRRYLGDFSYGRSESRWQNKASYTRQFKREQPRSQIQREHLRIIDDVTFLKAQARLEKINSGGGRHKGDVRDGEVHIVSRMMFCAKHNRVLQVVNSRGAMACPMCRVDPERALNSQVRRDVAERLLCAKLAELIRADVNLAHMAIAACQHQAQSLQAPDGKLLADLEREHKDLSGKIQFILANPGSTETDQKENSAQLAGLRGRRAEIDTRISELKMSDGKSIRIPPVDEVQKMLDDLATVLTQAAGSDNRDVVLRARRIVEAITGGRIVVSQQGDPRPKRGWLRGTFNVDLLHLVASSFMAGQTAGSAVQMHIDFRKPTPAEEMADQVKALVDRGLLLKEVAKEMSSQAGTTIGRNMVAAALEHWYGSRGLTPPDGRTRRAALGKKTLAPSFYEHRVEAVMGCSTTSHS